MDKKDKAIAEIYNESKERARWVQLWINMCFSSVRWHIWFVVLNLFGLFSRANGFKKQTEILRQKRAEFLEKYKLRSDGEDK